MMRGKYYNEFIETREPLKKKKTMKFREHVYFLGYIDGNYGEEEYKRYIPNDNECIKLYADGYTEGKNDRDNGTSKVLFSKKAWLCKLVISDYKNGFRGRKLTPEAEEFYNINYTDLILNGLDTDESVNEAINELESKNIRF